MSSCRRVVCLLLLLLLLLPLLLAHLQRLNGNGEVQAYFEAGRHLVDKCVSALLALLATESRIFCIGCVLCFPMFRLRSKR